MGIWDFINSGKEMLKWYTPEPARDNVVNGLQKLGQYMPDDEARAKIVSFSTKFAKIASVYAVKEAANYIPGGRAVAKIYSETVREVENECQNKQDRPCIKEIDGTSGENTAAAGAQRSLESRELELGSENEAREVENECQKKQDRPCIKEIVGNSGENTAAAGDQRSLESRELELGSENEAQVD